MIEVTNRALPSIPLHLKQITKCKIRCEPNLTKTSHGRLSL